VIRNPAVESMPRNAMRAMQLERLPPGVAGAGKRAPFCQNALAEAGVEPATLRSIEGLERLRFTRKADLRGHYPWGLCAAEQPELLRAHLGLNPEVAIVPPKNIPRSAGKAVRVLERSST
jgi:phenylacetate-CoA ligase